MSDRKVFRTRHTLRFGHCDISGSAYFPDYLDLLNTVNEEYWAHIGYPWHSTIRDAGWGTPTVHLSCDFTIASLYGDELDFEVRIAKVGRSSVTVEHQISCNSERRWSATQVLVASDLEKHTSRPWPDDVRSELLRWAE